VRAGHAGDDGAVFGADAHEGAGELQHLLQDAGLRRRESEGHRSQGQIGAGIPGLCRCRRGYVWYLDAIRVQDPVQVFNFDHTEVAANPVHLLYVLEKQIVREHLPQEVQDRYLAFLKQYLAPRYAEFIGKELQTAYLESYAEYGQNIFDRYVTYADYWIQDQEYRDPDTGEMMHRGALNEELEKIEKPAGISNPKDFRNEIVNFVLRARAQNNGANPRWTSYEKLRVVIEKKMFSNTEELLPVISFNAKSSADDKKKHEQFVDRMVEKGYTPKQVRLLSEWYLRVRKSQ
jgi:serine protein kinase